MSSQMNVKEVIDTLCRLFHQHGFSKINAEMFRLAKFNKSEARLPMLTLIYEILDEHHSFGGFKHVIASNQYFWLLLQASKMNYNYFERLIVNDERDLSSQELLVFLGFFMSRTNFFESLLDKTDDCLTKKLFMAPEKPTPYCASDNIAIDHVIVLNKKADFALRNLMASLIHLSKQLKKFSSKEKNFLLKGMNVCGSSMEHQLSLLDCVVANNLKLQRKLESSLNEQISLLKLHLKWITCEPVFWKWMTSVAQERHVQERVSPTSMSNVTQQRQTHVPSILDPIRKLKMAILLDDSSFSRSNLQKLDVKSNLHLTNPKVIQEFLEKILLQNIPFSFPKDQSTSQCSVENLKLNQIIQVIYEDNKQLLSEVLDETFSSVVQLPPPKR